MNTLTTNQSRELSTDLTTITAEIKVYQQTAGEAIFEIGRRLIHVKENDLAHGEFTDWVENNVGLSYRQANRFMRIVKELDDSNMPTPQIGLRAMYEIATLPEEHRDKAFKDDGSVKPVREIEQLKRQLRAEQSERERLEEEKARAESELSEAREELSKALEEPNPFSEEPYGVKLGLAMYDAIEGLSEWQKEYSWIMTDEVELSKLIESDPNIARMFNRVDKFWQQMSNVFHSTRNKGVYTEEEPEIIDADYSEIIEDEEPEEVEEAKPIEREKQTIDRLREQESSFPQIDESQSTISLDNRLIQMRKDLLDSTVEILDESDKLKDSSRKVNKSVKEQVLSTAKACTLLLGQNSVNSEASETMALVYELFNKAEESVTSQ